MVRRLLPGFTLALGLLAAGHAAPTHAAPTGNLLANPGFETTQPGHAWMPAGWDTSWSSLPTVFFGRDTVGSRAGDQAVSVANVSTLIPLFHNWSQTLVVGPELWNKDVVFTAWTRSNGVQGRGYILVQAYRDTVGKMARLWGVPRDTALRRIGLAMMNDPYVYLGAKRDYFSDEETGWVLRQVRVFVPPSTNLIIVRCGLFGTGQVSFDDAALTAEAARPAVAPPMNTNLFKDPGFEGDGDDWEYSLPPYDAMRADRETTVVHGGKASLRFSGGTVGLAKARGGVAQLIGNRSLAGKRLRLAGWVKCDSLMSQAYLKIYCTTLDGDRHVGTPRQLSGTTPWTRLEMEMDVPGDAYQVWAWLVYNAPSDGLVYFDDASLEIIGPSRSGAEAKPPRKPATSP